MPRQRPTLLILMAAAAGLLAEPAVLAQSDAAKLAAARARAQAVLDAVPAPGAFAAEPPALPALPPPSMTEPFAIGEALHQRQRVAYAVTSLIDLMGIAIDSDDGKTLRPGRSQNPAPFHLTESEVRALIAQGESDAARATADDREPYSFRDLYRAMSPLLPGVGIEELASAYDKAYSSRPDDLAPMVMMGQPIEPDTPLLRTQIWLLLVDGFAPPARTRRAPRVIPASYTAQGRGRAPWGTAAASMPQLQSPDPRWTPEEWQDVIPVLSIFASRLALSLFSVAPNSAKAHEGHTGPGTTLAFEARLTAGSPPTHVSRASGRALIAPRAAPALAGHAITWRSYAQDVLLAHGSLSVPLGQPMVTDSSGTVRQAYTPRAEASKGRGMLVTAAADLDATIREKDLVSAYYDLPPAALGFVGWADIVNTAVPGASLAIEWHDEDPITITIINEYDVTLDLPAPTKATRRGRDSVVGTLAREKDGTYRGVVQGMAKGTIDMNAPGRSCRGERSGMQILRVVARPVSDLGPAHSRSEFLFLEGRADGGYLRLELYPVADARYSKHDPCQAEIDRDEAAAGPAYLPFNDFLWTHPEAGLTIAIPAFGDLLYSDDSRRGTVIGSSYWVVRIQRKAKPPETN